MRARHHRAADQELAEATIYHDRERTGYGDRFVAAFLAARDFLLQFPNSGKPGVRGTRSWKVMGFRYHIVYVIRGDVIFILAVAHDRRRPGYWLSRLR
jgi:plasmid stabilization system protein ParE